MNLVVIDTETTSPEPQEARIVTAFVGLWNSEEDRFVQHLEFLVNPGVDIPEEASAIHGISTEQASRGMDPVEFLELFHYVAHDWAEYPHVLMNAAFDLSLLNAELVRYGYAPFDWNKRHIIDPLVIDRAKDRYRKGKKNLTRLAEVYGVPFDESLAHDAAYDCYLAVNVAIKQIEKFGMPTNEEQAEWHREWSESFQEYMRRVKNDPELVIDSAWPFK